MFGVRERLTRLSKNALQTARSRIAVRVRRNSELSKEYQKRHETPQPFFLGVLLSIRLRNLSREYIYAKTITLRVAVERAVFVDFIGHDRLLIETIVSTLFVGLSRARMATYTPRAARINAPLHKLFSIGSERPRLL